MLYHIWLQNALGFANKKIKKVLSTYSDVKNIYTAKVNDLILSGLFTEKEISKLSDKNLDAARKILNTCNKQGIEININI